MAIWKLELKEHSRTYHGEDIHTRMIIDFDNGYSASVVTGRTLYSSNLSPYEIAVVWGGKLVYDTPVTQDVEGYKTAEEANEILQAISHLPAKYECDLVDKSVS